MSLRMLRAAAMSVHVVRTFVRLREELRTQATLEARIQEIEETLVEHDASLRDVYRKLRPLLLRPPGPKRAIGFHVH